MTQEPAARGTAFGFEIRSKLALRHLRNGEGQPLQVDAADIEERPGRDDKLLIDWKTPEQDSNARLYHDGNRYLLFIAGTGWFRIDPQAGTIVVPATGDLGKIEEKLWGIPALLCFLERGDHALHAAAVESNGSAILIAGSDQVARSAVAAAYAAAGHRVLTQELACLRLGSTTGLVPGPSLLRIPKSLMPSIDMSLGNGSWKEERNHYSLDATRRGTSKPIPVRALVLLGDGDPATAPETLIPAQAMSDLWSLSFRLPTEEDRGRCFEGVADLASKVPVFRLHCERTTDLERTIERISSTSLEYA